MVRNGSLFLGVFSAICLAACAGQDGANGLTSLIATTAAEPSDCPDGGISIQSGTDTNGDGVLQAAEVTSSQVICNGAGGTAGSDGSDGADGADGADGEDAIVIPSFDPPMGPAGTFTLDTSGGEGADLNEGASGGDISLRMPSGSLGGHIKVFNTGVVDASFTVDVASTPVYLGSNPLEITSDTTVFAIEEGEQSTLSAGSVFRFEYWGAVYVWDGSNYEQVTGLSVAAGATLTFNRYDDSLRNIYAEFENDIFNAGTITTQRLGVDRPSLRLRTDSYVAPETGRIDLTGGDAAAGSRGGEGGNFSLDAMDSTYGFEWRVGSIVNRGTVDTSGGDGDSGGDAGTIDMAAGYSVKNTGDLVSNGGAGTVDIGGAGNAVYLYTEFGSTSNSGMLRADGGAGFNRGGGGGDVILSCDYPGLLKNSGALSADGGAVTGAACTECYGGRGGNVSMYVYGGGIASSGELSARGGDAKPAGGSTGYAGDGGEVYLNGETDEGWNIEAYPLGTMEFSGSMDASGGDGFLLAGDGGTIEAEFSFSDVERQQELIFYGYASIDLSGSAAQGDGGSGGDFLCENGRSLAAPYFGGACINYAAIDASGGDGKSGGEGGRVGLRTDRENAYASKGAEWAINHGDIDASGGSGILAGGDGGNVELLAGVSIAQFGTMTTAGGDATGPDSYAGDGGRVELIGELGTVENSGDITASGGACTAASNCDGGNADRVLMVGDTVNNSGDLSVAGGNGAGAGYGLGGDASVINVMSIVGPTVQSATGIILTAGTGFNAAGRSGEMFVDGVNVSGRYLP